MAKAEPAGQAMAPTPLLPRPLTKCPFTWQTQWWWLDYQIDLAAKLCKEEIHRLTNQHRLEMGLGMKLVWTEL